MRLCSRAMKWFSDRLLLIEELFDDGEVFLPVAHPGCVSGTMKRVHPSLWVASPELGAPLRCKDVLVRLEDEDPSTARMRHRPAQTGSSVGGRSQAGTRRATQPSTAER